MHEGKTEDTGEKKIDGTEIPAGVGGQEDPFATGRERMAAISTKLNSVKEKVSSWFTKAGSSISRFWNKTKHFGGEAVAATLSAPELAKQADKYTDEKAHELGVAIGEKAVAATEWVDDKFDKMEQGVEAGYEWSKDKVTAFGNKMNEGRDAVGAWADKKTDQLNEFATEKKELVLAVASYAKDKTVEKLVKVKDGVADRYDKVKAYGENAYMSAKMKVAEIKQKYRDEQNRKRLEKAKADYDAELAQAVADLQNAEQAEMDAKNMAEQMKQRKEALAAKISLMENLSMVA